jgi:hypothetical protein
MAAPKLTDEQVDLADKIAARAKAKGLNPDFVLSMVMQESGFNHALTSDKGAQGVMQITPDTAATYKCENPKDVDQNIDCGLAILSDLISKPHIGNDPYKVLAGYNAGPNTTFFKSGNLADLPDETINHMDKVSQHYGGELPTVMSGVPDENTDERKEPAAGAPVPKVPAGTSEVAQPTSPYAVIGGVVGGTLASGTETGKKLAPLIPNLINKFSGAPVDPNKPVSKAALQNWLNAMLQSNSQKVNLPISELEKLTGKKIRTMSEVGDAYRDLQAVQDRIVTKPMVKMVDGRPGVFEQTGRMTSSTVPGRPAIDLTPYEVKGGNIRQAVGRQFQNAGDVVKSVGPSVGRIIGGAFGGANAGVNAYDAWEMAQKIKNNPEASPLDYLRLGSKTLATAGGALSMVPLGYTQVLGAGLQAPEAIISLGEGVYEGAKELNARRKAATREDVDRMLTSVDAMGNPIP